MLQSFSKWKNHISQELSWADLMLKAAAGDKEAYRKLLKKEKQQTKKDKSVSYW